MHLKILTVFCAALLIFQEQCQNSSQSPMVEDPARVIIPLEITLQAEPTSRISSLLETDPPGFAGLPDHLDTMLIWAFVSSYEQQVFDQFQDGKMSAGDFAELKIDSTKYTLDPIQFKVYGVSGLREGKKVMIIDTDQNLDFSDEQILELDTLFSPEEKMGEDYLLSPWLMIHYDYYLDGQTYRMTTTGRIDPFLVLFPSPGKLIEDLKFSFLSFETLQGTVELRGRKYNLLTDRNLPSGSPGTFYFSSYGQSSHTQENVFLPVIMGEKIPIDGIYYELTSFDLATKSLELTQLPVAAGELVSGGHPGMKAPKFEVKPIGGEGFTQVGGVLGNKYQFLHAWGTWCGPCKADHEHLVELAKKYDGDRIEFVGLVLDKDEATVRDYMEREGIYWKNMFFLWDNATGMDSLLIEYNIWSYPSYLIVDPKGMVIARGELDEMEQKLEEISSFNK